jgi:hypothetical protein
MEGHFQKIDFLRGRSDDAKNKKSMADKEIRYLTESAIYLLLNELKKGWIAVSDPSKVRPTRYFEIVKTKGNAGSMTLEKLERFMIDILGEMRGDMKTKIASVNLATMNGNTLVDGLMSDFTASTIRQKASKHLSDNVDYKLELKERMVEPSRNPNDIADFSELMHTLKFNI